MINLDSKKLKDINKPARYVGGEVNQVIKSSNVKSSIVLCYPNLYEKAMSNYIVNMLYNNINDIDGVWCKRCFAPDIDFENFLKENNILLYSLEDFENINKNDILLFVIDNELDFTNFLSMLSLAGIPIDKSLRNENSPKIAVLPSNNINTQGIRKFADYIFECNSEKENIQRLLKYIKEYTSSNYDKKLLFTNVDELTSEYKDVKFKYIENSIVPSIKINNSSIIIDVSDIADVDFVINYIKNSIKARGVNKVSFINQDKIDEFKFCELIYKIKMNVEGIRIISKNIDFNKFKPEILDVILPCMEESTIYFNIVTCSKKVKNKVGIGTDKEILIDRIKKVFKNNRNSINLNFNIGLPEETYEDIDNIFDVAQEIASLYSKNKAKDKFSMKLTLNYYIPTINDKMKYSISNINKLETKLRYINEKKIDDIIKLDIEDLSRYMVKTLLKNGDERIADIIYDAYKSGARFDLDNKKYNKYAWEKIIFDKMKSINEILKGE